MEHNARQEKGFILAVSLIVMTVVVIITAAFFRVSTVQSRVLGYDLDDSRALCFAEAGVEKYIYLLKTDLNYRTNAPGLNESLTTGSYSTGAAKDGDLYTITSTGLAGSANRSILRTVEVEVDSYDWSFDDYALYFGGSLGYAFQVAGGTIVDGDIFSSRAIQTGKNCVFNGDVASTSSITLGSGTTVAGSVLPNQSGPPAPTPALDTTYYDGEITIASGQASGNRSISGEISGTTYVNGSINITGNITGSGTLVAKGAITIDSAISVGDNITLIAGSELSAQSDFTVGGNCLLYASSQVTIGQNGNFGSSGAGSTLITPGTIDIAKGWGFYGFVYAESDITLAANCQVNGTIAGQANLWTSAGTRITSQADLVDFDDIPGFSTDSGGGGGGTTVTINLMSDWEEIPAS